MALTEIDRTLLKRCLAGESGAWKDFVDRFIGLFIHVINHTAHSRSVEPSTADVDDLCSEVFLAIVANNYAVLRQFRGNSSLATYLTVIARRVVVKEMTRRRMAEALGHVGLRNDHAPVMTSIAADGTAVIEQQEEVERLLEELPEEDARVVRLFHLEGKSYREISSELGIPENSIGPVLSRARERLRQTNVSTPAGG